MPKAVSAVLAWSGSYEIRVAGGSKHQRELAELFDKFTSGRAEAYCVAGLVREPNGAVRVQIDERTVGYLDPITAAILPRHAGDGKKRRDRRRRHGSDCE